MTKNIKELLAVVGKNIDDIQNIDNVSQFAREITISRAQSTAMLAKQFINAANLIQKGDVMSGRHEATDNIIGFYNE